MKVLLVHNRYRSGSPSGENRVVDQEAAALANAGHDVERFERCSDDIAARSVAARALVPAQVLWSDEARRSLTRVLRRSRPEVVHVHNTFPLLSASVLYACRAEKVPVVTTLHNYRLVCASGILFRDGAVCHDCVGRDPLPAVRHRCYRGSTLATLPVAAELVAHRRAWRTMVSAYVLLSQAQRDIVASDGLPPERLFVKANFAPPVTVAPAPREDIVVYAGRLSPQKGVDLLMEAWDRYVDDGAGRCRLRLVVAGTGPLEGRVETWAATRPSVEWVGMLSHHECTALLSRSRAAVVPSAWEEPFGLVAVEAMAAGVPPVAPAHGSFGELISHGADGTLFEPGSATALADVLRDVDEHPEVYEALGRAAQRTYQERFTPEANLEQLLRIYRFAVDHPPQ